MADGSETREQWIARQAVSAARNPMAWAMNAESLMATARAVRSARIAFPWDGWEVGESLPTIVFTVPVEFMLMAMAVENLAKGLQVATNPLLVAEAQTPGDPLLTGSFGGHDIAEVLRQAGVSLTNAEQDLCRRMAEQIVWAGRYPVPKRAQELARHYTDELAGTSEALYQRLHDLLRELAASRTTELEMSQRQQRIDARPAVEEQLAATCSGVEQVDGVTKYHFADEAADQDAWVEASASLVVCVGCQTTIEFTETMRAAVCGCDTLRVAAPHLDHGIGRWLLSIEEYPPPDSPAYEGYEQA